MVKYGRYFTFIIFVVILVALLLETGHVLEDKDAKKNYYAVRYENRDTIDIIFLGNSHANNAFLPMELWDDRGYTAYSMSQMSQTFPLVYYSAIDAIKFQHPRLLVVDLFAATSYSNDFDNMHKTVDNLTFGTRIKAIEEFIPEDKRIEYTFPIYLYHDRWKELEVKDFIPYFLRYSPNRNPRKGATLVSDWNECSYPTRAVEYAISGSETKELSEEALYWYGRLKALCDSNGTKLLFVVIPYQMPIGGDEQSAVENIKMYNATELWCSENGVGYLNLFRELDNMEFDFETDMQDVSHVNLLGAEKVTRAVGDYISDNYDIPDRREDGNVSALWDSYYSAYLEEKEVTLSELKRKLSGGIQE